MKDVKITMEGNMGRDAKKMQVNTAKWKSAHVKRFEFYFNLDAEEDLYKHLQEQPSKQQYIKELIRQDMERHTK